MASFLKLIITHGCMNFWTCDRPATHLGCVLPLPSCNWYRLQQPCESEKDLASLENGMGWKEFPFWRNGHRKLSEMKITFYKQQLYLLQSHAVCTCLDEGTFYLKFQNLILVELWNLGSKMIILALRRPVCNIICHRNISTWPDLFH